MNVKYTNSFIESVCAVFETMRNIAPMPRFDLDPAPQPGLPSVIEGRGYKVRCPARAKWLEVPFTSPVGEFAMEVTFCEDLK